MKIVDEKGRLFGKINVIDSLVLLFLLSFIPMLYFGHKLLYSKKTDLGQKKTDKEFIEMEFPCTLIKIKPEILGLIAVGDTEFDVEGNKIGEITWLGEARTYQQKFYLYPGERRNFVIKEDPVLKEVPAKLKLRVEIRDYNNLYYKDKVILFDSILNFKTDKYLITLVTLAPVMPVKLKKERWLKINVKFTGVFPELVNIINTGHIEKDSEGRIVGKLTRIIDKKPSEVQALKLEENKIVTISDPYRSDMVASLDLLCTNIDGELYFKNYPIKIGSQITFTSELYLISGMIASINLENK